MYEFEEERTGQDREDHAARIEWGSGRIILLILQLKRLKFASNMAVDSNNKCNVILVVGIFEKHPFKERKSEKNWTGLKLRVSSLSGTRIDRRSVFSL
ncbi:MAG: hypothetical protein JRG99_15385 [Deltaproteobacteria bacterium]|jgi:hypothetical protein|nr:hypothetical protein [Deltaproteobacteria bacterium]